MEIWSGRRQSLGGAANFLAAPAAAAAPAPSGETSQRALAFAALGLRFAALGKELRLWQGAKQVPSSSKMVQRGPKRSKDVA